MRKEIIEMAKLAFEEGRCVEDAAYDRADAREMARHFEQVVQAALDGESIPYPLGDDCGLTGVYDATRRVVAAHLKARQPEPSLN